MKYYKANIDGNQVVVVCPQSKIGYTYPELFIKLKSRGHFTSMANIRVEFDYFWADCTTGMVMAHKDSEAFDQWTDDDAIFVDATELDEFTGINLKVVTEMCERYMED